LRGLLLRGGRETVIKGEGKGAKMRERGRKGAGRRKRKGKGRKERRCALCSRNFQLF